MATKAKAKRSSAVGKVSRRTPTKSKSQTPVRVKKSAATGRKASPARTDRKSSAKKGTVKKARGLGAASMQTRAVAFARLSVRSPKEDGRRPRDARFLRSIRVRNLLSFGPDTPKLKLRNLNVLVGLNSSGKSNLLEVVRLLQALPNDISQPIRLGGGIEHWLHKTQESAPFEFSPEEAVTGEVQAEFGYDVWTAGKPRLRKLAYRLGITEERGHEIKLQHEQLDIMRGSNVTSKLGPLFRYSGNGVFEVYDLPPGGRGQFMEVERDKSQQEQSYFYRKQASNDSPVAGSLSKLLEAVRVYGEWTLGRASAIRRRQSADEIDGSFREDLSNIAAVVSNVVRNTDLKDKILQEMARHTNCVKDFNLTVGMGYTDVYFREGQKLIPVQRMSDGALRLFFLLAVLCDPNPPPLICIEEPEVGVHADVIPALVKLMEEAAQRTQLIVTTHSEVMIDSLTHNPEALVVCEQVRGQTEMSRLSLDEILRRSGEPNVDHGLAWFWQRGYLGGTK